MKTLKRKAWIVFSRFIRIRDPFCVSCLMEGKKTPTAHAGHWRPNSERSQQLGGNALWYDPRAINGQCMPCNNYKSGNTTYYDLYLEEKYGHGILQELHKLHQTPKKWTREEIQTLIDRYDTEIHM